MARCESTYQNRDSKGEPVGSPLQCTRDTHDGAHRNFRPGYRTKWPESASEQAREQERANA